MHLFNQGEAADALVAVTTPAATSTGLRVSFTFARAGTTTLFVPVEIPTVTDKDKGVPPSGDPALPATPR